MKKLLTIMLAFVLGIACLGLVACGGDGDTGVVGDYELKYMVYDGTTLELGDPAPWGDGTLSAETNTLKIKDDGTWVSIAIIEGQEQSTAGTWTYENNVLTMIQVIQGYGEVPMVCLVTDDGDVSMTANMGMEITYVFTKA